MIEASDLGIPEATVYLLDLGGEDHFDRLKAETTWMKRTNIIYGRKVAQPRLTAWYGDEGRTYRYSGVTNDPLPWTPTLLSIRDRVQSLLGVDFNSALLNLYRSGRDSIGFHSDDEPELGDEPIIASVSYGGERTFVFRHRAAEHPDVEVDLPSRSLLVMMGETQRRWKHGIEKCASADPRINITFRRIFN